MSSSPVQALFQQAMALHRAGRLEEAERAYRQIMRADPRDYPSRCMLGRLYLDLGRLGEAEKVLEAAVKLDGRAPPGLSAYGLALLRAGKFRPAAAMLERAAAAEPGDWTLRHNLGDALLGLGRREDALTAYDRTLALEPSSGQTWARRASVLLDLGRVEDALADSARALASAPADPQALAVRAEALAALGRDGEALEAFALAIAAAPSDVGLLADRARLRLKAGDAAEAVADCTAALKLQPRSAEVLLLRSAAFARLRQLEPALADCDAAITLAPKEPEAHFVRGLRLEALGRLEAAVEAYDRAYLLHGRKGVGAVDALYNRSAAQMELRLYDAALAGLREVLAAQPRHAYAFGAYAQALRLTCEWSDVARIAADLRAVVLADDVEVPPGTVLAYFDDPAVQLAAGRHYAARNLPPAAPQPPLAEGHDRLRIAYLSADFRSHPAMRLAVQLFELHDRQRFEVHAVSIGPDDGSAMRARAVAAFDHFHDVQDLSDEAVVALMRERGIDIVIDLAGFTTGARPQIFAHRPAPLAVNLLGFPGTLGTQVHDYILVDEVVAPMAMQQDFTEQLVHLPHSYLPNDARRAVPTDAPSRAEAGLPETGFVFCSFNNSYKITPQVFDIWMRLLMATEGSVLWLLADNPQAVANLRREAAARGVDPARLVFAPRVEPDAHLARHRLADLFLDTTPFCAHTTASDAVWMGLPLVTCLGGAFAARVGASVCRAAGLDELVAADLDGYERLALELARDPQRLAAIRARLDAQRLTVPLFDAELYCQGVEAAFETMWARARRGEPPAAFSVTVQTDGATS